MENQKNYKGVIVLLIVITVVLSALCILFATGTISLNSNKANENDINENVNNNNNNENSVSKLDTSKEWVHDASYNLPTNKDSYYGHNEHTKLIKASDLVVPYININSDDAKKVNQEIYKLYEDLINKFNENLKSEIFFTLVEYKTYTNDNIISVIITTESAGTGPAIYSHYTYNFNVDTGKLLSFNDAYEFIGLNEDNITDKATQAVTNVLREEYSIAVGDDFDTYNHKSINNYKTSVSNDTIKFFIDGNKKLNIIVALEMDAGNGKFDTIITVE